MGLAGDARIRIADISSRALDRLLVNVFSLLPIPNDINYPTGTIMMLRNNARNQNYGSPLCSRQHVRISH